VLASTPLAALDARFRGHDEKGAAPSIKFASLGSAADCGDLIIARVTAAVDAIQERSDFNPKNVGVLLYDGFRHRSFAGETSGCCRQLLGSISPRTANRTRQAAA